jgi:hypothetical protein
MSWEFSIGWLIFGVILLASGATIVIFYRQISENLASGVSSYDRVKFFGILTSILGLIIMTNLHTFLLGLLVDLIFIR